MDAMAPSKLARMRSSTGGNDYSIKTVLFSPAMNDLKSFARMGAKSRLETLAAERAAIFKTFPELRAEERAATATPKRKKKSAAARKAQSERMKAYWAAKKGAKK